MDLSEAVFSIYLYLPLLLVLLLPDRSHGPNGGLLSWCSRAERPRPAQKWERRLTKACSGRGDSGALWLGVLA
jgi:hypothetical protein